MNLFKNLLLGDTGTFIMVCVCVCVCVCAPDFQVEVQLDSQKHKQKGGVRRALFLDSHQASLQRSVMLRRGVRSCHDTKIYLRVRHVVY